MQKAPFAKNGAGTSQGHSALLSPLSGKEGLVCFNEAGIAGIDLVFWQPALLRHALDGVASRQTLVKRLTQRLLHVPAAGLLLQGGCRALKHQHELAARLGLRKVGDGCGQGGAQHLLVQLGHLAAQRNLALSQCFTEECRLFDYCPSLVGRESAFIYGKRAIDMYYHNAFVLGGFSIMDPRVVDDRTVNFYANYRGTVIHALAQIENCTDGVCSLDNSLIQELVIRPA